MSVQFTGEKKLLFLFNVDFTMTICITFHLYTLLLYLHRRDKLLVHCVTLAMLTLSDIRISRIDIPRQYGVLTVTVISIS